MLAVENGIMCHFQTCLNVCIWRSDLVKLVVKWGVALHVHALNRLSWLQHHIASPKLNDEHQHINTFAWVDSKKKKERKKYSKAKTHSVRSYFALFLYSVCCVFEGKHWWDEDWGWEEHWYYSVLFAFIYYYLSQSRDVKC